jgi:2'-5' RNA ligase
VAAPDTVRAFVALPVDDAARAAVVAATADLRRALGDAARWTDPDTVHLTLRFLGDVAADRLAALRSGLDAAAGRCAPVELRLVGAGAFPPRGRPRVFWIGIDPTPGLAELHARVDDACAAAGLGREARPFRPHLTVARARPGAGLAGPEVGQALAAVGFVAARRVASLHLMRSELTAAGARHTPLHTAALGAVDRDGR